MKKTQRRGCEGAKRRLSAKEGRREGHDREAQQSLKGATPHAH